MIKISKISNQTISKDDFVIKGDYINEVKLLGIKLYNKSTSLNNDMLKEDFNGQSKKVGFGG